MYEDCRAAADLLMRQASPADTLLVWGYRPEIQALTRLPAGSRFLDSQPLTGVLADRHLRDATPTAAAIAARNRRELAGTSPYWVVDGLGPYNAALAITSYPDLADWFSRYEFAAATAGARIYRLRTRPVTP